MKQEYKGNTELLEVVKTQIKARQNDRTKVGPTPKRKRHVRKVQEGLPR
jgi:hypothetical protein